MSVPPRALMLSCSAPGAFRAAGLLPVRVLLAPHLPSVCLGRCRSGRDNLEGDGVWVNRGALLCAAALEPRLEAQPGSPCTRFTRSCVMMCRFFCTCQMILWKSKLSTPRPANFLGPPTIRGEKGDGERLTSQSVRALGVLNARLCLTLKCSSPKSQNHF